MAKRERSINWEQEEKALLREIIKPYLHIIENKDISTNTNKAKNNAWASIVEQFNKVNKRSRDKKQIMNQWKVTKLNSKKQISLYKKQITQTGGGPKPPSPDPEIAEVLDMIPQEFEVDYNEFDCDGLKVVPTDIQDNVNKQRNNNTAELVVPTDIQDNVNKQRNNNTAELPILLEATSEPVNITEATMIDHCTPSTSKPIIPILKKETVTAQLPPKRSAKKKLLSEKFNFAEASYEDMHRFRSLENERQNKEHELRIKCMEEIHKQSLVNLKLQEEMLRKMLNDRNNN